jgi:hypothetical protein
VTGQKERRCGQKSSASTTGANLTRFRRFCWARRPPAAPAALAGCGMPSAYVSIRQHTSAYVSIRPHDLQHSVAEACEHRESAESPAGRRHHSKPPPAHLTEGATRDARAATCLYACVSIRQHMSAYVSIRQHTPAYASMRQHTSAYVSIRIHEGATRDARAAACLYACVSIRQRALAERVRRVIHHTPHSAYVSIRQHTSTYARAGTCRAGTTRDPPHTAPAAGASSV